MTTSERHIRLTGPYATADLDWLLVDLSALDAIEDLTVVHVDLARLGRISAPAVAVLVATLLDLETRGVLQEGSLIVAPHDSHVQQRLRELDVYDILAGRPLSDDFVREPRRGLRPCHLFTGADEPGTVAQSLTSAMAQVCQTDEPARSAMWFALNEIAQNVVDHAEATGGAVAVAEVTRGGVELEVAIADHGIGIRTSLETNPAQTIGSTSVRCGRRSALAAARAQIDRGPWGSACT